MRRYSGQINRVLRHGLAGVLSGLQRYNSMIMNCYRLTAVIWKEGRHYVSKCPELGVASFGPTPEKAKSTLTEAARLYISNAKKLGIFDSIQPAISSVSRFIISLDVTAA